MVMTAKIPTIKLGKGTSTKAKPKSKAKKAVKPKAKAKARPKSKTSKKAKRGKRAAPETSTVPATMAPPAMEDTRPTRGKMTQKTETLTPETPTPSTRTQTETGPTDEQTRTKTKTIPSTGTDTSTPTGTLVQGVSCTWIGDLSLCPTDKDDIPVCPSCNGRLIYTPDRHTMELGFDQFELGAYPPTPTAKPRPHPGYTGFMQWLMQQAEHCWPNIQDAADAYLTETGRKVDPVP